MSTAQNDSSRPALFLFAEDRKVVFALAKYSGSKPGGPQSKNLVPLNSRPEEEAAQIRSKGGIARAKKLREEKTRRELFTQLVSLGIDGKKGKPVDLSKLKSIDEVDKRNVTVAALILITELKRYLATGDKESRDWIMNAAFPDSQAPGLEENDPQAAGNAEQDGDGVRIHLIRGMKPEEPEDAHDKATPNDSGGAGE